ncbi:Probable serine/threonine-protein kinase WNK2 (OsWNK2) (Protein DISEASE RELATIVE SIGNAL 1) (Protein kinase with no lysine 2) [Durusdinium trenchii]|uniref:Probable serine/threonine-protein kinase WNK2 (OsWNK2) (Protein DISEASE RELATIVE SIGNAL 1) (Protein kinase with no lysine 2) n=1 Tax=Durusdinium trenchii TaxID=1381693 RepID=A0ABP0S474_9DINO
MTERVRAPHGEVFEEGLVEADARTIVEKSPHGRFVRFNEKLGQGAFKQVFRAYDSADGVEVAWNKVPIKQGTMRVLHEMKILQNLDHDNIIKFFGSWLSPETETVNFVTELITSGTLKAFVQDRPISLGVVKRWCRDILNALVYLHSHNPCIIHRDLKCDNIFINGSTGDIRIGDLGLASWDHKRQVKHSALGTPEYMAPEMFDEFYDEQVDIYAFGMCVLEMITKETPFMECSTALQIYSKKLRGELPCSFDNVKNVAVRTFVLRCLQKRAETDTRPSASELLTDPFFEPPPPGSCHTDATICDDLLYDLEPRPLSNDAKNPAPSPLLVARPPPPASRIPASLTPSSPESFRSVDSGRSQRSVDSANLSIPLLQLTGGARDDDAGTTSSESSSWECTVEPSARSPDLIGVTVKSNGKVVTIEFEMDPSETASATVSEMQREGCLPEDLPTAAILALTENLEGFRTNRSNLTP